jgi:hypothetical protein
MDRRSISITASRCMPGAVMQESISHGSTPPVIANDTDKASLPVNRLERQAGKLARAVLRGGGDGDTASLPDPPLRCGFRQQLKAGVRRHIIHRNEGKLVAYIPLLLHDSWGCGVPCPTIY